MTQHGFQFCFELAVVKHSPMLRVGRVLRTDACGVNEWLGTPKTCWMK